MVSEGSGTVGTRRQSQTHNASGRGVVCATVVSLDGVVCTVPGELLATPAKGDNSSLSGLISLPTQLYHSPAIHNGALAPVSSSV